MGICWPDSAESGCTLWTRLILLDDQFPISHALAHGSSSFMAFNSVTAIVGEPSDGFALALLSVYCRRGVRVETLLYPAPSIHVAHGPQF
jgi:hypothetical protein